MPVTTRSQDWSSQNHESLESEIANIETPHLELLTIEDSAPKPQYVTLS